jgi:superfamily II DNA or RNA helicase
LLSVHTLEIGYDIPDVRIAVIISNSSNFNQIAQRIGRVIRKTTKKNDALIYVIYIRDSKDNGTLRMVKSTIDYSGRDNQLKLTSFKS